MGTLIFTVTKERLKRLSYKVSLGFTLPRLRDAGQVGPTENIHSRIDAFDLPVFVETVTGGGAVILVADLS